MPKRKDINKILIIGSGPIIIGQAGEFDYSGSQACKALRNLGYHVILVNSNPATIMTDPDYADVTYIEPLNVPTLEKIIARERPDAILPNLGGQSGLNLTSGLHRAGILQRYDVQVIGVKVDAIERGEDRIAFKETMRCLGIDIPRSHAAYTLEEAENVAEQLGFPLVVRPAYTMGGTGGGHAYNIEEFRLIAQRGLAASLVGQILVEESVIGWEELELEVVRDSLGQKVTVCFIENVDAMGIHTGDSFCVAPMLTISEDLQKRLEHYAYNIVDAIEVIGGTNIQFAHDPVKDRVVVIEINPRTSRSSALASKATGFPIALISAMLACGITLDEIPYWREGTLDKYTPSGDHIVVKFARFAFEKFKGVHDRLGTQMRAVGEVMSIGKTFKEAFQKAIRSLENGRYGLGWVKSFHRLSLEDILVMLAEPSSERQFLLYEALRKGADIDLLSRKTYIKPWYLQQMKELVDLEEKLLEHTWENISPGLLRQAKQDGFSDRYLARLFGVTETEIREKRKTLGIVQGWDTVPVSGVKKASYYYSSYYAKDTIEVSSRKKIMVLGGGPYRIGQGIEFDYCCVHAAFTLRDSGYETIMVNCNPETVSTDYDTSDKLYFEPLTVEDVLSIYEKEKPHGVLVQFGGQTPLNIARELTNAGVRILGTSFESIDLAEDRESFRSSLIKLGIPQPESGIARSTEEAITIAKEIGYPLLVRPSYVLGGRGMEIVFDETSLRHYVEQAVEVSPRMPILIDRFLEDAVEAEADALADGKNAFVPSIMQHIEFAGIHSGDSACVIPPVIIPQKHKDTITEYTRRIAVEFGVIGLINIQYAIAHDQVYILEANPRASRTVPLVSKVCGFSMARIATELALGKKLSDFDTTMKNIPYFGVKETVFPFNMFQEVDPLLGPEMRSTGEVLALDESFALAFFKSQEATQSPLPTSGTVLITVADRDKEKILETARKYISLGFQVHSTRGTARFLKVHDIDVKEVFKVHEGRPNIIDEIKNGDIQLLINTPHGSAAEQDDSEIRKMAIRSSIPYITTPAAAKAAVDGIEVFLKKGTSVKSLQEYHRDIK